MTTGQALQQFFSSFGLTAYPTTSVPYDTQFPFLTYETPVGDITTEPLNASVSLWYHTESESTPNAKAEQIRKAIGVGGVLLKCDDGAIWVRKGEPWCNSLTDESDKTIKRRQLNVTLEYLTI